MKIKSKSKWIIGILLILGIVVIYFVLFYNPRYFSYRSCIHGENFFPNSIKEVGWSGESLKIKSVVEDNCIIRKLTGSYEVDGDTITLNVGAKYWPIVAGCNCDYENEFNIKGLPKEDYKIILKSGERINDQLTIKANGEITDACDQDRSYQCYLDSLRALQYPQAVKSEDEKSKNQKEFTYDTEENKRIAESDPDFLRLFKKYEHYIYDSDDYNTIHFSFDKEHKYINIIAAKKGTSGRMETGLIRANSFAEGVKLYVDEKKYMESPNSLYAQLQKKLGIEIVRAHENETGFEFVYKNEFVTYSGPWAGYEPEGILDFNDRKGAGEFKFLSEFPNVHQLSKEKLLELISTTDKIYQLVKNNTDISIDSIPIVYIQPTILKARFSAKTNPEKEHNLRFMTIHSFEISIKDPIEKKYELDINSGEFKVLTGSEKVDKF